MIKNDRQYRITKAEADQFQRSLAQLAASNDDTRHPAIRAAQLAAVRSQLAELLALLREYESLRDGKERVLELSSLEELPDALIKARIAAGLSQRDLAARLGVKEQQIQRYEASGYASASLGRITEVVAALGLQVREDVFLPSADVSLETLLSKLSKVGVRRDFVMNKLLPPQLASALADNAVPRAQKGHHAIELASTVARVFGWTPATLFSLGTLPMAATESVAGARFKMPSRGEERWAKLLAIYARHVCNLVIECTPELVPRRIDLDARHVRAEMLKRTVKLDIGAALQYCWDLGVVVLPLAEGGGFHGACWRIGGRNVIVLKQGSRNAARWLHDLLHELYHAGQAPDVSEFEVLDDDLSLDERRDSNEEVEATEFAGDVVLDGRAEELAKKCVARAKGKLEWLKSAVPTVAQREGVEVGALANYMAYRLSLQGENWWGTAANLQVSTSDPWVICRDFLVRRLDLGSMRACDRDLLLRAFQDRRPE